MRANEFYHTGQWVLLTSESDKKHWAKELINLVQTAYNRSEFGPYINTLEDVLQSEWLVLDTSGFGKLDCVIFYRHDKPNEPWKGFKIQGIGHSGDTSSKAKLIAKVKQQLNKDGWWIESAANTKSIGTATKEPAIKDEKLLKSLFPNSNLHLIDQTGKYQRKLINGEIVEEYVFGKPILKH